MQVTNVRVLFERKKQPAQYEEAHPAVEFSAVVEDGADPQLVARDLMLSAASVVYAGLGYAVPDRVAESLATVGGSTEVSAPATPKTGKKTTLKKPAEESETDNGDEVPGEEETSATKKRGRPKGSKNTAPKKGSAADKALDTPDDEVPTLDAPEPEIRTNPEDRKDPSVEEGEDFTSKDLHNLIHDSIKAGDILVTDAKKLHSTFEVARTQDLTDEQLPKAREMLQNMIAARTR